MSSPPPIDIPTSDLDDVEMNDGTIEESMPNAPTRDPLFLASPSTAAGTPTRQRYSNAPNITPLHRSVARRNIEMNTPKRTPLFARECLSLIAETSH